MRLATTQARQIITFAHSRVHSADPPMIYPSPLCIVLPCPPPSLTLRGSLPPLPLFIQHCFFGTVLIIIRGVTPTSMIAQRLLLADSRQAGREIVRSFLRFTRYIPFVRRNADTIPTLVNLAVSSASLMSRSRLTAPRRSSLMDLEGNRSFCFTDL